MENVINKLAEIETGTARILQDANEKKADLARELDERIRVYDQECDARTAKELDSIRKNYQKEMERELSDLRTKTNQVISHMEETYQNKHDALTDSIVKQILT